LRHPYKPPVIKPATSLIEETPSRKNQNFLFSFQDKRMQARANAHATSGSSYFKYLADRCVRQFASGDAGCTMLD